MNIYIGKTILLVEDDRSFRESLKKLLRKEGFQILEAESGADGMELLKKEKVDLVMLDYYLGGMNGLQFLEKTKGPERPPVIILTAFGDWGIYSEVVAKGARDCLLKPVKRNELMAVVEATLTNKNLNTGEDPGQRTAS